MLSLVRPQAYNFIKSIVTSFDQTYFPNTSMPEELVPAFNHDNFKRQVSRRLNPNTKEWEDREPDPKSNRMIPLTESVIGRALRKKMQDFPPEVIGNILAQAQNVSEWIVISGLLDPEVPKDEAALDSSARALLSRLKIKPNGQQPKEQLLTHVFMTAWKDVPDAQKIEYIRWVIQNRSALAVVSFGWRISLFKLQDAIANFFGNDLAKITVVYTVMFSSSFFIASKILPFTNRFFKFFRSNRGKKLMQNPWIRISVNASWVFATYCGISFQCGRQLGQTRDLLRREQHVGVLRTCIEIITPIVRFPLEVISRPLEVLAEKVVALQGYLASRSARSSIAGKIRTLTAGSTEVYMIWMHLMQNPQPLYQR